MAMSLCINLYRPINFHGQYQTTIIHDQYHTAIFHDDMMIDDQLSVLENGDDDDDDDDFDDEEDGTLLPKNAVDDGDEEDEEEEEEEEEECADGEGWTGVSVVVIIRLSPRLSVDMGQGLGLC